LYNGRPEQTDGDRVLGIFLNAVPFRLDVAGKSWHDVLDAVTTLEAGLVPYRRYPLALLSQRLNAGRPFFATAFNYTHFHAYQQIRRLPGLRIEGGDASDQTYFALTAQFNRDDESGLLRLALDYRTVAVSAEQAADVASAYIAALSELCESPDGVPVSADARHRKSSQRLEQLIGRLEQMSEDEVLKALAVHAGGR
jgi:Condensation domain